MTATTSDRLPTLKVGDLEEGKQYTAYAPNGQQIVGTVEMVPALAGVSCFTKPSASHCGYEHSGESELFWDGQTTQERDGKTLFQCEGGEEWTVDQLVFEDES